MDFGTGVGAWGVFGRYGPSRIGEGIGICSCCMVYGSMGAKVRSDFPVSFRFL